ncbi:hypothetical protein GY12_02290 [Micrococcus luteus]|nr:hypothetical protein GY12_02290 [Micrococcus luteus]
MTSGITRRTRRNTSTNTTPIRALPTPGPIPWYRWYAPRSSARASTTTAARVGRYSPSALTHDDGTVGAGSRASPAARSRCRYPSRSTSQAPTMTSSSSPWRSAESSRTGTWYQLSPSAEPTIAVVIPRARPAA